MVSPPSNVKFLARIDRYDEARHCMQIAPEVPSVAPLQDCATIAQRLAPVRAVTRLSPVRGSPCEAQPSLPICAPLAALKGRCGSAASSPLCTTTPSLHRRQLIKRPQPAPASVPRHAEP
ncbi:hypothetical protein NDU88_006053 [Pleurodeles waltl]|uniref:Uncharacterized protein n=1 Tax=Pleurodeles waltl TaxID=8319 RepID=A0AAV7MY67_PLEWA|nr:hypothetical protein NDU88_006053 [Pleurodeles waltl]